MYRWYRQDYRSMPWKNGGGVTTELARFPEDANTEQFIWRLSRAEIKSSGPFSHFAQIDRSLAVLSDSNLLLQLEEAKGVTENIYLNQHSLPYRFNGETPVNAVLEKDEEPVLDLNFMSRRTVCQHFMQRLEAGEHFIQASDAQQILMYCARGSAKMIVDEKTGMRVQEDDLILLDEERPFSGVRLHLHAHEGASLYCIRISFLNSSNHQKFAHAYVG